MNGKANTLKIANIPLNAAEETTWALPKGCRCVQLQCRTAVDVRLAVVAGESNRRYFTVKSSSVFKERNLDINKPVTLYLYAASAVTVEAILGIAEGEEIPDTTGG